MGLSSDLISQFVKTTNDDKKTEKEMIAYGTVTRVETDSDTGDISQAYVMIDGAKEETPLSRVTDVKEKDRVIVMVKNHSAVITGNLTSPSARTERVTIVEKTVAEFDTVIANKATLEQLYAAEGRILTLETDNIRVNEKLTANEAEIKDLKADRLTASEANITYATITELNAAKADIGVLGADVANIDALIFGSAAGNTIQTSFANAVIAQLGDAQIKSAMIESISAGKITSGDIMTNTVRVVSEDGRLIISDETIQISDSTRVRVQIGKDASDDYSINVWDADGNLMFSEGGITDSAIKEAIIRNDMVSDTANIAAHKLDIDSLFDEINGSTKTIKSTKVYLDEKNQTLDIAFKSLSTEVTSQGEIISSQGTKIEAIQGQISNKIWQQDVDTATGNMSTQYSTLEQNLNSFKTTVGETYATNVNVNSLDTRTSSLEQTTDGLTARLDSQIIGGTNILRGTGNVYSLGTSASWAKGTWRTAGGGTAGGRTIIDISDAPNPYIKKGFRIEGDDSDRATAQDNVPVTEGQTYTMSCYARGSGSLRLQVGKSPYSAGVHTLTNVTTWTRYSFTFVAGDGNGLSDGKTNVYFTNRGVGTMELCGFKLEVGTDATDWNPSPYTDYLNFSSSGLAIGDMTSGSLGKNVLIDSDSVDIRNGSTTLASFGEDYLYLAKNSRNATIDMCNGLATMYHASKYSYDSLFVIDTAVVEIIGASTPLCLTANTTLDNVSIQFANKNKVLGGVGIVGNWLRRYGSNMYDTYTVLDSGNLYDVIDSGWFYGGAIGEDFTLYSNDTQIQYRKVGKAVSIRGAVQPVRVIPGSTDNHLIFTLPEGYRPSKMVYSRCQGSGVHSWLLSITSSGQVRFARYGNGAEYVDASTSAWLPFNVTFFID